MSDPGPQLDLLRCPITGSALSPQTIDGRPVLVSQRGQLGYPIEDGIPVLIPERAAPPPDCADIEQAIAKHPG